MYGRPFILRTDHQALQTLFSSGGSGHRPLRLHHWLDRLYQHTFETEYRPGVNNTVADFLSRVPVTPVFEDSGFDKDVIQMIGRSLAVVTPEELKEHSEVIQFCKRLGIILSMVGLEDWRTSNCVMLERNCQSRMTAA